MPTLASFFSATRQGLVGIAILLGVCGRGVAMHDGAAPTARAADGNVTTTDSHHSWPLFRGNPQATGAVNEPLPEKPELLWTFVTKEGFFETTAVIANGTVYAGSIEGWLYAIDLATGQERWKFFSKLGFTAAPAVHQRRVYIGDADGRFYCLDSSTGKPKWQFDTGMEIDSGANFHGDRVMFGSQDGNLYCLNAENGRLVWKYESADQIRCFPSLASEHVLVAGCDGRLHVVSLSSGKPAAFVDLEAPTGCTPAVVGDMVYVGTEGGTFFAINWRQARIVWRSESPNRRMSIRSSAAADAELAVVGSRDKAIRALDAKTGRQRWFFTTRGQVDSSPVMGGDRVFVGSSDGHVYALDRKTGQKRWQYAVGGRVLASPAIAAGRLVIGTTDGGIFCFGQP